MRRHDDRSHAPHASAAALGAALVAYGAPALTAVIPSLRRPLGVADATPQGTGVGLTFDDGPHPQGTPATLELLAGAGVRATFFLVGEQVQRRPQLAAEVAAAGHQVGLHCQRHRNLLRLTPGQVAEDLARGAETIAAATGVVPLVHRPPYGILNLAALRWVHSQGLRCVLWSHWGRDWEARATPASIVARATEDLRPGSVLLLHDADDYGAPGCWRRMVAGLPAILEELERRRLAVVPV